MNVQPAIEQGISDTANVSDAVEAFISNLVRELDTAKGDVIATSPEADVTRLNAVMSALSGDSIRFAKLIEQKQRTITVEAPVSESNPADLEA